MRSRFDRLSKPEVDFLCDNCNFSKDEMEILKMASNGTGDIQISEKIRLSTSSITKKKRVIFRKIMDFLEVFDHMTTIYVDGKRVAKEELKNKEIKIENVKKILADKLTRAK